MPDIKTTRSELLATRKKIRLAESGHKLLKKKRDGLILEFMQVLEKAKQTRKELQERFLSANEKMQAAMVIDGIVEVKNLALALKERPSVEITTKNIMGVTVPQIQARPVRKTLFDRGYGIMSSTIRMEEMVRAYEELLESIIAAAETETKLRKLLQEIEKTKRRVNALEYVVMPRLRHQSSFIRLRLEELERENIFRLKRIKAKIAG